MKKYSPGQLRILAEFFNNLSLAWFTGGVITPYFTKLNLYDKLIFTAIGLVGSYLFMQLALRISKNLD